jgi:DNA-binding NtrC family response regulator
MQNRGFIHVYSEPGKGATFHIYLPRHIAASDAAEDRPRQDSAPRGRETILVVEDEPGILKMTSRLLELQGYTVLEAESPEVALRITGESSANIDLILTDVIMPGMNGHDLAVKLAESRPAVKCLFMSGYTANVIAHHGVLDEHQHFIQKPFSKYDLANTVRAVLDTP